MPPAGMRPYVWMLSGCFWFSLMAVLAHAAGRECDWQVVALSRSGLATLFALATAVVSGARLVFLRPGILWVRSVAGSCSMVATFYALTHLPASEVLTLTNTFPVWVALLSWPMAGERPTAGVWAAVLCSVGGVALTQRPHLGGMPPAAWLALAASGFTAVAMLGLNRLRGVTPLGIVVHFSAVSTLFCGAAYLVFDRGAGVGRVGDGAVLWKLLGVGATATVGQVFLTLAFSRGSATKVAVVGLSQVVMVMAMEAALPEATGGQRFDWVTVVGTALVLGPTAWLLARSRKAPAEGEAAAVVEEVAIE
jgi:drug/metabolite transporter (DMT)-like permease